MKKYINIIKPVIFLSIFVLITTLLSFVFTPKNNTKKAGMEELRPNGILSERKNSIDVLVVGDSESYTSISPMEMYEEYGITSYILGSDAQKIYQSYNYLLEAFKTQKPKVVLLETNTFYESKKIISIGERYIPFIRYHNRWFNITLKDFYKTPNYTNRNVMKGYYFIRYTNPMKESKPKYMWKSEQRKEIPDDEEYYIRKIYEECKKNGAELMFYSAPNHKNWAYNKHNSTQDLADDLGIDYIDTNIVNEIDIDWKTDTKDVGDHVNYYGAKKVSSYVGKYLVEKKNIEDHRNDSDYSNWDEDLIEYKKILADENIIKY